MIDKEKLFGDSNPEVDHTPAPNTALASRSNKGNDAGSGNRNRTQKIKEDEKLLTVAELAEILSIDESTVYKWADQGRIAYIDLGRGKKRCLRFRKSDVRQLIENSLVNNSQLLKTKPKVGINYNGNSDQPAERR